MIRQIQKVYKEGAADSKEREDIFLRSLQMWLRPFSEEINRQQGTLVLLFYADGANRFRLDGVSEELKNKLDAQHPGFQER